MPAVRADSAGSVLSVVIVTYNSGAGVADRLRTVAGELEPGDELIVVDNASSDGTAASIERAGLELDLVRSPGNLGFAAGCNAGAERASGDLLLFLNPDVAPERGAIAALRASDGWDAWQGLITYPDGKTVNSAGGEIHYLGISWAGGCERPVDEYGSPREVGFASGACLMLRRAEWDALGGFEPGYFMYCEDVDLSLRVRLRGGRVGIEPAARFRHDYSFEKGSEKWRFLERNRWFTIIRTYPRGLLAAVLPALLVAELSLTAYAWASGWGRSKLRAQWQVMAALPRLARQRRAVLSGSTATAGQMLSQMQVQLDSPNVGRMAGHPAVRALLRMYWRAVRAAVAR
jgi:GT2 family glycosyltransferase